MVRSTGGTGRRTATTVATLSHSGLAKYEAQLYSQKQKGLLVFLCVYEGMYEEVVEIGPDNT